MNVFNSPRMSPSRFPLSLYICYFICVFTMSLIGIRLVNYRDGIKRVDFLTLFIFLGREFQQHFIFTLSCTF